MGGHGPGVPGAEPAGLVGVTLSQTTARPAARRRRPVPPYVPRSCRACEGKLWRIATWRRDNPEHRRAPTLYACRSWRHEGACADFAAQRDFARIRTALEGCAVEDLLMLVLTLPPAGPGDTLESDYKGLVAKWTGLQKYLTRGWGGVGLPPLGRFDFVTVVEQHATGRPHVNVIIHSPTLAAYLREHPPTESDRRENLGPHWFRDLVSHHGWGYRSFIGHAHGRDALANYVTKVSKGPVAHPALMGEVTKTSQLPTMAPRRMRRLRSSKGFLPPARLPPHPDWTGALEQLPPADVMRERQDGGYRALTAHLWAEAQSAAPPPVAPLAPEPRAPDEGPAAPVETAERRDARQRWARFLLGPVGPRPTAREPEPYTRAEVALSGLLGHLVPWRAELAAAPEVRAFRAGARLAPPEWMRPARARAGEALASEWDALGEREYRPPERPRPPEDDARFKFGRELAARFNYHQDRAEAEARGEDPSGVTVPRWVATFPRG